MIKEIIEKYGGKYSEEKKKSSIFPSGKYSFHPQKGILEIKGSRISINVQAVGDASRVAEPYRIILILKKKYNDDLKIYPISILRKIFRLIVPVDRNSSSRIQNHYTFAGDNFLISNLINDSRFCDLITNEKVYITLSKRYSDKIVLKPAYGIDDINHFDKLVEILKLIEQKVIPNGT